MLNPSNSIKDYAQWFRASTPYISAHRDKTFVVLVPGEAVAHPNITNIVHDLALLHVLGVRLLVVHGARPQIDETLTSNFANNRRITDEASMLAISGVYGQIRAQLEALFSTGLPNTPLHNVKIPVISANLLVAQPVGVLDGVDHMLTGLVRKVETERAKAITANQGLILQSPMGYSPSGQMFNLTSEEVAAACAIELNADKLIVLDELDCVKDGDGARISTLTPAEVEDVLPTFDGTPTATRLAALTRAVRAGVDKGQLVSYCEEGALLAELFTAEGHGTQILERRQSTVRGARLEDVAGIVELIRPLEEQGVLVRRERERLEQEIDNFLVAELDGVVVGCCAVYPFDDSAELACVAVHERYRNNSADLGESLGSKLLKAASHSAASSGAKELFALTTQAKHWFVEHGFAESNPDQLPAAKKKLYNWQRNSAVLKKAL